MSESLHNEERILNYLDGLMSSEEKADFESQLKNDAALKQQLENLTVSIEAVKQYGTRQKVRTLHYEMMQELKQAKPSSGVINIKRTIRVTMAVAAGVLLILIGVHTFNHFQNTSENLYNEAFVDYSIPLERGAKQNITAIERDYSDKNYTSVIKDAKSTTLLPKDSFLTALSFLKTGNTSSAIQWLNKITAGSPFHKDAEFYLSLAYLKDKNYQEALNLMERIHNEADHPYNSNISSDLIERVKKLR